MWAGVDPGSDDGALAVLSLDARQVVAVSAFVRVAKGLRVNTAAFGLVSVAEVEGPSEVADVWRAALEGQPAPETGARLHGLTVEDLFASPKNPQAVVPLAEACGALAMPLHRHAGRVHRLFASVWRPEQLGRRSGMTAAGWEALALAKAVQAWPEFAELTQGWTKAQRGAAAEACWMARAAYVRRARR